MLLGDDCRPFSGIFYCLLLEDFSAPPVAPPCVCCVKTFARPEECQLDLRRSSGLVATKRDAAWFDGSGRRRLPLLLGRFIYRWPLPLDFLRCWGRTLHPINVGTSRLRRNADKTILWWRWWSGVHRYRPISSWHAQKVHCPVLRMDLCISKSVPCSEISN